MVVVSFCARYESRERPTPPHQVRLLIGRLSRQQCYFGLRRYDFPVRIRPGLSQTIMAQRDLRKGRCGRPLEQCTQFRMKSLATRFREGAELIKRAHLRKSFSAHSTTGARARHYRPAQRALPSLGLRPGRTGIVQPAFGIRIAPAGHGEMRPRRAVVSRRARGRICSLRYRQVTSWHERSRISQAPMPRVRRVHGGRTCTRGQ
jgi:hypothetical protein